MFTHFRFIMKSTVGRLFSGKESRKGAVTPLQAIPNLIAVLALLPKVVRITKGYFRTL